MRKQEKRQIRTLKNIVKEHVYINLKQYLIVSVLFIIGVIIAVIFINNDNNTGNSQIENNITTFIECLKTDYQVDKVKLLKELIINNIFTAFILWFMGCVVIGIPIVYGIIVYRGFSLGYTISTIILTLGTWKGIMFSLITLLLQNLIIIPCIFAISVSGTKLYKVILKDKRKENIKIEIIRHTIFSLIALCFLILSSFIEVYISDTLLGVCVKYF